MSKTNKPYKCMYCGERYPTLSHVSICPCDKFSNIPPSENTDNKELVPATDSGVADSVGDALSFFADDFDYSDYIEDDRDLTYPLEFKNISFHDDDLPQCFKGGGA